MWRGDIDRRTFLASTAGVAAATLSGCITTSAEPPGVAGSCEGGGAGGPMLRLGGSSTVFPIAQRAASFWMSNYPPTDREYWGPSQYGIETDQRLADYWARKYGFEPTDSSSPPFQVTVGLSHSGTGLEKLMNGQVDIGNSSAPVAAEFPGMSEDELAPFKNHVVGVDAQPLVVSPEIYDAGVTQLTAEQVRAIYHGEITNWDEIPAYEGPPRSIQAVGRAEGSGTDTAFRVNMLGSANASMDGVDVRRGQNQQVKNTVANSNNAIGYMALAFVDQESAPAIALSFEGQVYRPGENLAERSYPLSRDLHCYTWEGTSNMEAAFLHMIISEFGQQNFVKHAGYAMLTDERRAEELAKLPDPQP
ncbi:MAG: PstS family phosphate ABC transporter substrate-binding protein [Halorhabdus sp.]